RYDLRYATTPIDAGNFDAATPVAGVPAPQATGSAESFEVAGLEFNTTYYFALVVEDERANRSPVSNPTSGTTLGAPELDYSPASFMASLLTGGVSVQRLEIRNRAEGTLDFSTVDSPLPSWLRVVPPSGRVPAGASMSVDIRFDATRLDGGNHATAIELRTNDAAHRVVSIPASLHVTSAPDIAVSPPQIDFGVRFTGTCTTDTVVVSNIGAESLTVSEVRLAHPDFSCDASGFVLQRDEERVLPVQYCPQTEEMVPGLPRQYPRQSRAQLVLASNDPDHPDFSIPLFGDAVDPPVIEVSPPSLSAELVTGAVSTQTLTISNRGASDLDVEIGLEEVIGAARIEVLGGSSHDRADIVAVGKPLSAKDLESLIGSVPAMVVGGNVDRNESSQHRGAGRELEVVDGEVFGSDQNEFLGGPRTRGNLFRCTTPTTLLEHRFYLGPSVTTQMWFVVYEGEEQTGVYNLVSASNVSPAGPGLGWYSSGAISVPMRAGKFYLIAAAFQDATLYYNKQNIDPYPIPASFGELAGAAGWTWQPSDQIPPGPLQFVSEQAFAEPVAYYQTLVTGSAVRWLSLDREAGTVAPGASLEVAVRFDAFGVAGGEYDARVRVASNDPSTPEVVVPAHASVTGAADIAVSPASLDFGTVFVGTSAQDTVTVSNTGTEFLFVSSLSFDRPGYAADATSFVLVPGTRRQVIVSFSPASAGVQGGTLSIASIDPDEPVISVALNASAMEPPVASVSPPSFDVGLSSGETASPTMTIRNSGAGPLEFEIETSLGGSAPARAQLAIPRSSGDFPRGEHAPSIGAAPQLRDQRRPEAGLTDAHVASAGFAFGTETQNRQAARVRLTEPERIELFGSAPNFIWTGDFGVGDNSFAYAVDELNHFVKIDTLSGVQTDVGTLKPVGLEVWTGMALDPTDGTMYAVTTDTRQSWLYRVDVVIPSATLIGRVFSPAIVALAADDDGRVYGLDVINDELVSIDKSTGEGTVIGSLGYDANFGHGMAFDPVSEQLYVSAFNNFRFQSELRIADRATGATTVVGVLGGLEPGGLVQLGWLAIPGLGGVPWMRATPRRGVVAPGESVDVAVQLDARSLMAGNYDAQLRIVTNDPHAASIVVPVRARIDGDPEIALSDSLIEFGDVFVGGSGSRTLTVSNPGTDALHVGGVSTSGDYSVDMTAFTLGPGEERQLEVILAPSAIGERIGELVISSDDADEASVVVLLHGDGRAPPVMVVTPGSFDESLATGQRLTRRLTIDNTRGAADLVWNAGSRYAGDAFTVSATSPAFRAHAVMDPFKEMPQR
ncbi:MAG TPA: choice-of-anchor D domain-containing protein, partial [Candidatus Krumholzibacteria bacterium]|nr:choice-of-anchor D domain-containing protein [Candidatus Krumholzibacteria bacterium]